MKSPLFSYRSGGARARPQKCSGPDRFYVSPPAICSLNRMPGFAYAFARERRYKG
jgi:hypothetical protein